MTNNTSLLCNLSILEIMKVTDNDKEHKVTMKSVNYPYIIEPRCFIVQSHAERYENKHRTELFILFVVKHSFL